MIDNRKIGVIILAAGSSSRLGYAKQLVEFKGKTLLQHVIDVAENFQFDSRILVLGANSDKITENITPGNFKLVINEEWEKGMSASIRKGITESLKSDKELEHVLILLSDQPFVSVENIERLLKVQLEENTQATFSEYQGNIGVPAIFSREVFSEFQELKGDQGAKKLIKEGKLNFRTVKFEKGNFDVDTPEDVESLKRMEE